MFEEGDEELIDSVVDQQSENSKSFEPSLQIPPKSKYHPAWKRNRIHHHFDSTVFCLWAPCSFPLPNLLQWALQAVSATLSEEVAHCVCHAHPSWSSADLSSVLNLGKMTRPLRNFSALCLNQPARMLSLGWACSSVTSLLTLTCRFVEIWPANSKPCP